MVYYCLELPYGAVRHFPTGTYDKQISSEMGKLELTLMNVVHSVWYAFKHVKMKDWKEGELRAAELTKPVKPKPEEPTRKLDEYIRTHWRGSLWLYIVLNNYVGAAWRML